MASPRLPDLADPSGRGLRSPVLHRQHEARGLADSTIGIATFGRLALRMARLVVVLVALFGDSRILEHRLHVARIKIEPHRDGPHEALGIVGKWALRGGFAGDQAGIAPDRLSVTPPIERECPAWQRLARIPFALAVMQHAARCEALAQAPDQHVGALALGRADCGGVPFLAGLVVDRDEGRLAAHGQAHIVRDEIAIDFLAQRIERGPSLVAERIGHARLFGDAGDLHIEREGAVGFIDRAADRRRGAIMRGRGKRDMALPAQQSRRGIKPDPAGAGDIDLGPGVQVGEVLRRAGRPIERLHVGLELEQVAGDEARGEAEVAQDLYQQPGAVAAGAGRGGQRRLRRLHPRLHADQIPNIALHTLIERDQEIDGVAPLARDRGQESR